MALALVVVLSQQVGASCIPGNSFFGKDVVWSAATFDGSSPLPTGFTIAGDAYSQADSITLTTDFIEKSGSLMIVPTSNIANDGLVLSFKYSIFNSGLDAGGDGLGVHYAPLSAFTDRIATYTSWEKSISDGLSIGFVTYTTNQIQVSWKGTRLATVDDPDIRCLTFCEVIVSVTDKGELSLSVDAAYWAGPITLPDFDREDRADWRVVVGARTGFAADSHIIDSVFLTSAVCATASLSNTSLSVECQQCDGSLGCPSEAWCSAASGYLRPTGAGCTCTPVCLAQAQGTECATGTTSAQQAVAAAGAVVVAAVATGVAVGSSAPGMVQLLAGPLAPIAGPYLAVMGTTVMSMIDSVQFISMSGSVDVNLPDNFVNLTSGMSWANFDVPLSFLDSRPSTPPSNKGRRHLMSEAQMSKLAERPEKDRFLTTLFFVSAALAILAFVSLAGWISLYLMRDNDRRTKMRALVRQKPFRYTFKVLGLAYLGISLATLRQLRVGPSGEPGFFALALIVLLIYVFGFPGFAVWFLSQRDFFTLENPKFRDRFGPFYEDYKRGWQMFFMILFAKKLTEALLVVLLRGVVQLVLLVVLHALYLFLLFLIRPHASRWALAAAATISFLKLVTVIVMFSLYGNESGSESAGWILLGLSLLIIMIDMGGVFGILALILYLLYRTLKIKKQVTPASSKDVEGSEAGSELGLAHAWFSTAESRESDGGSAAAQPAPSTLQQFPHGLAITQPAGTAA